MWPNSREPSITFRPPIYIVSTVLRPTNKTTIGMNRASTFTSSRECFLYASDTFSNLSDAFDSLLYD